MVTKSGLMVGLGESFEEMVEAFGILREHRVQVLTVGQYLRPTEQHLPVVRYWHPDEFAALEQAAYELGFESVAAGPLVRSSYHADETPAGRRAGERAASRQTQRIECPGRTDGGAVGRLDDAAPTDRMKRSAEMSEMRNAEGALRSAAR